MGVLRVVLHYEIYHSNCNYDCIFQYDRIILEEREGCLQSDYTSLWDAFFVCNERDFDVSSEQNLLRK